MERHFWQQLLMLKVIILGLLWVSVGISMGCVAHAAEEPIVPGRTSILSDENRQIERIKPSLGPGGAVGARLVKQFPTLVNVEADYTRRSVGQSQRQITNQTKRIWVTLDKKMIFNQNVKNCKVVVLDSNGNIIGRASDTHTPWRPKYYNLILLQRIRDSYNKVIYFYTGSAWLGKTPITDDVSVNLTNFNSLKSVYVGLAFNDEQYIYTLAKFYARPAKLKLHPTIDNLSVASPLITGRGLANDRITNDVNDIVTTVGPDNRYSIKLQIGELNDHDEVVVHESNGVDEGTAKKKVANPYFLQASNDPTGTKGVGIPRRKLKKLEKQRTRDEFLTELKLAVPIQCFEIGDIPAHNRQINHFELQMDDYGNTGKDDFGSIVSGLVDGSSRTVTLNLYGLINGVKTKDYPLTLFRLDTPPQPAALAIETGQFDFLNQRIPLMETLVAPNRHPKVLITHPREQNVPWVLKAQVSPLVQDKRIVAHWVFRDGQGADPQSLDQMQVIYRQSLSPSGNPGDQSLDVSADWYNSRSPYPKGIYLDVSPRISTGNYTATIEWQLANIP